MNAIELLRKQFESAHQSLEATVGEMSQEVSSFKELGKAIPAGAAFAHAVLEEDILLSRMLANKEPIFRDVNEVGISEPIPDMQNWDQHERWYKTVNVDIAKFRKYAKKVYQATDDYVASLKDEDLDTEIERPVIGKQNIAFMLTNFFLLHIANLTGEISAAKGVQGLKGYPF